MKVRDLGKSLIRGHVWRTRFPSWEHPGQVIEKYALILQEGPYFFNSVGVCVVLLTSVDRKKQRKTDVLVPAEESGHAGDIWALCDKVYTIPVDDLVGYEYCLSQDTMTQIDTALMFGLGLA